MLVYRICIPVIAIFGIVGNILNIIVLRFSSEIIMIIALRRLTMVVMVFVSNAYLFNLSQPQFKDSVYFFLKVAIIIIIVLVRTCHHLHLLNKPQKCYSISS